MTKDQIRAIFLAHGFTIKEGQADLKPYVYAAAEALLSSALATEGGEASDKQEAADPFADWDLIRVKHLAELVDALDRADRTGYMPDAIADSWEAFQYVPAAPPAQPAEQDRIDAERWRWLRDNCFDWEEPGEGDSFGHASLHYEADDLSYSIESLNNSIDAAKGASK